MSRPGRSLTVHICFSITTDGSALPPPPRRPHYPLAGAVTSSPIPLSSHWHYNSSQYGDYRPSYFTIIVVVTVGQPLPPPTRRRCHHLTVAATNSPVPRSSQQHQYRNRNGFPSSKPPQHHSHYYNGFVGIVWSSPSLSGARRRRHHAADTRIMSAASVLPCRRHRPLFSTSPLL